MMTNERAETNTGSHSVLHSSMPSRSPRVKSMQRMGLLQILLASAVLLASCGVQAPPEHAKRVPKPGKAELPATPELDPPRPPVKYPEDGAYSVSGLLSSDKKSVAEEVWIRGYVASISVCPVTEKLCKPAPHLWLSDQADGLGRRLLVGGERNLEARHLLVGQRVSLKGRFGQSSADGVYFSPTGMLLLAPLPEPTPVAEPVGKP